MKNITKIDAKIKVKEKLKVAAYARVSTGSFEQKLSLETQKAHYEKVIRENSDYEFAGIYFDEGVTGTRVDKRDGLLLMLKDAKDGKINFILTKSISRFARNISECLEMVRKLLSLGVGIYFEKEEINTKDMESEFMLTILASLAESESKSISENNKWSIKKRFQNGTYIIAYPPYGYRNENGKMVIDTEEAEVVKQMFKDYLSGKGFYVIAKELNERNIPSKKAAKWYSTTVNEILSNEKYTGDVLFQKTYTDGEFNRHKNKGDKDRFLLKNHHKAIISHEDFEKVQKLKQLKALEKGNGEDTERYQNRYAFSGKMICGECGEVFKRRHHYNPEYIAWTCKGHIMDSKKCSIKYVKDEDLKYAFVTMINKLTFANKKILVPLLKDLQKVDTKTSIIELSNLEEETEELLQRKQTLITLMTSGILETSVFTKEKSEIELREKEIQNKKRTLENFAINNTTATDELKKLISITSKGVMQYTFSDEIFDDVVDKIDVINRTTFVFNLKCGLSLKEEV